MNGNQFDALTRKLARLPNPTSTRRSLLGLVGAMGAAAIHQTGSEASPRSDFPSEPTRFQVDVDPLIAEIAFRLEYDRGKIVEFVQNAIRYEPYEGALRGPVGTLWARAGNSADTAQLLAELLRAAKIDATINAVAVSESALRAQFGRLADASALDLLERAVSSFADTATPTAAATPDDAFVQQVEEIRAEAISSAVNRIDQETQRISSLLQAASVQVAPGSASSLPQAEIARHFVVTIPLGATTDLVVPTGVEVADPVLLSDSPIVPDSHLIRIRLVADVLSGDTFTTQTLLEQQAPASALANAPVSVYHLDSSEKTALGFNLGDILEGQATYYPSIFIGSDVFFGDLPITFGNSSGVIDVLADPNAKLSDGETLAEYLEIEIESPGFGTEVIRRVLFDRIAGMRANTVLDVDAIEAINPVDFGEDIKAVPFMTEIHAFAVVTGAVPDNFRSYPTDADADFLKLTHNVLGIQRTAQALANEIGGSLAAGFVNRPNIHRHTLRPEPDRSTGQLQMSVTADLMFQSTAGETSAQDEPLALVSAVCVRNAEQLTLDGDLISRIGEKVGGVAAGFRSGVTVGTLFAEAERAGIDLIVVQTVEDISANAAAFPEGAIELASAHVAIGRVLITPASAVSIAGSSYAGWWVFDPATGSFTDQMANGLSTAVLFATAAEYAVMLKAVALASKFIIGGALGTCVAAIINMVADLITASPSSFVSLAGFIIVCQ